ncbi:MAG TPA: hypothetical protein VGL51_00710, partial [Solirubrobacteraceae bacterium]
MFAAEEANEMNTMQPIIGPRGGRRRILSATLAALGCAAAIAGCGGSSPADATGATTASAKPSQFALAKCMRSHGVPNFPDPSSGPDGGGLSISRPAGGGDTLTVNGVTLSGPAFQSASKACKQYLPGGGGPPPPLTASQKRKALAMAQCMRTHGVPNFPDPDFSG